MKDEGFINVQGWMINNTPFSGNDLLFYAIVFGFSQDGRTKYKGGYGYIAKTLKITRRGAMKLCDRVIKTGYIKTELIGGINHYWTDLQKVGVVNKVYKGSEQSSPVYSEQSSPAGSEQSSPINNSINNINNNKEEHADIHPLTPSEKLTLKRIGKVQFDLIKDHIDYFRGLDAAKKSLLVDWLEHRKNLKHECKNFQTLKGQANGFFKYTTKEITEAIEIALSGGKEGWRDIRYAFKRIDENSIPGRGNQNNGFVYEMPKRASI